uniref:Protein ORF130 n=1 Tax=Anguillid herpesvirus 1 TaxID=150286 RepID=A0A8E5EUY5_9VIRU|nr:protein ORF130 [Anguillid herpesvirus 1]QRM17074.1 protein ORF130 [Anguillid herpesvirus 1]
MSDSEYDSDCSDYSEPEGISLSDQSWDTSDDDEPTAPAATAPAAPAPPAPTAPTPPTPEPTSEPEPTPASTAPAKQLLPKRKWHEISDSEIDEPSTKKPTGPSSFLYWTVLADWEQKAQNGADCILKVPEMLLRHLKSLIRAEEKKLDKSLVLAERVPGMPTLKTEMICEIMLWGELHRSLALGSLKGLTTKPRNGPDPKTVDQKTMRGLVAKFVSKLINKVLVPIMALHGEVLIEEEELIQHIIDLIVANRIAKDPLDATSAEFGGGMVRESDLYRTKCVLNAKDFWWQVCFRGLPTMKCVPSAILKDLLTIDPRIYPMTDRMTWILPQVKATIEFRKKLMRTRDPCLLFTNRMLFNKFGPLGEHVPVCDHGTRKLSAEEDANKPTLKPGVIYHPPPKYRGDVGPLMHVPWNLTKYIAHQCDIDPAEVLLMVPGPGHPNCDPYVVLEILLWGELGHQVIEDDSKCSMLPSDFLNECPTNAWDRGFLMQQHHFEEWVKITHRDLFSKAARLMSTETRKVNLPSAAAMAHHILYKMIPGHRCDRGSFGNFMDVEDTHCKKITTSAIWWQLGWDRNKYRRLSAVFVRGIKDYYSSHSEAPITDPIRQILEHADEICSINRARIRAKAKKAERLGLKVTEVSDDESNDWEGDVEACFIGGFDNPSIRAHTPPDCYK